MLTCLVYIDDDVDSDLLPFSHTCMHAPTRQRLTLQIEELRTTLSRVEEERDGALQRLEEQQQQQQQPSQPPEAQASPSPSGVGELADLEEEEEEEEEEGSGDGIPQEEAQEQEKEGNSDVEKRALVAERCVGLIDATVP